jgi:hypothetical protein
MALGGKRGTRVKYFALGRCIKTPSINASRVRRVNLAYRHSRTSRQHLIARFSFLKKR